MRISSFDIKGKGYIYKLKRSEKVRIPWNGDYFKEIIELAGYVINRINKEDGVPIIEERRPTPMEEAIGKAFAETLAHRTRSPV